MEYDQSTYRVKVRKEYLSIYQEMISRNLFPEHNQFFTFCACVGSRFEIEETDYPKAELCQINTFNTYQLTALRALILEQSSSMQQVEFLEWFSQIELLADTGLKHLTESVLKDFIVISDRQFAFVDGSTDELQIKLSSYVYEEIDKVPF